MEGWQEAHERRTGRRPATPQGDSSVRAARAARAALEGEQGRGCAGLRTGRPPRAMLLPIACPSPTLPLRKPPAPHGPSPVPPARPLPPIPAPAGDAEPLISPDDAAWAPAAGLPAGMRRTPSMFFPTAVAEDDYADRFGHYK